MNYDKSAKLTRAPHYIDLGSGDNEIRLGLRPLDDAAISTLDQYCRTIHIASAVKAARELDPETAALVRQDAIMQASSITILSDMGANIISSLDGIARLLWEMAGAQECKYSEEEIRKSVFSDPGNGAIEDIKDIFISQNFDVDGSNNDESENDAQKKKAARKKRAKKKTGTK